MGSEQTNQYGLSRSIPSAVERQVRQECGFGCVVCGSAIYQYEHIDPEYKDARKHDPGKIALLCGACHDKVTRRQWSKQKIMEARLDPFCLRRGFARDSFDYGVEAPTIVVGGATIYQPDSVLTVLGENLLEVKGPEISGGPVRISGRFYDRSGRLIFGVEDNCWKGPIQNWDIETVGRTITVRRGPGDVALVLRTEPRKVLTVERLDMYYRGIRVFADDRGVCIGPPTGDLYGFQGQVVRPVCCVVVLRDDGRLVPAGLHVGIPAGGRITNNTVVGAELAMCFRGQGLILGIGYRAVKVSGSLVRVPYQR